MPGEQFIIYNSELEAARDTSDRHWLKDTFATARRIIEAGGKVNIMQRFSGSAKELVAIIDNMETLEFYRKKYTN